MAMSMDTVERVVDVVVIGSGGAGLLAALRARDRGATVTVIEKSNWIGGTTAVSGGVLWIPQNHHMPDVGVADSRAEALTYLRRTAFGQSTSALLEAFVDRAPEMVHYVETRTELRFTPVRRPDYHPEWDGGKPGGRSLDNAPFDASELGPYRERLRRSPHYPPITYAERYRWTRPEQFDWELIARRVERGVVTLGAALVAGLLKACVEGGVEVFTATRAETLERTGGRISGVRAIDGEGRTLAFDVTKGVVIASGGFEWNARMVAHFLRGPLSAPATPPWNTGDGIRMGIGVGANIGNMNEAAWFPVIRIPGEEYDGHPLSRLIVEERSKPGSIVVNRRGRRFVNEASSYDDFARSFHVFDGEAYDYANLPAYLVFDERFRGRYNVTTAMPGDAPPAWFTTGETPAALARALGIDGRELDGTIARFNATAARGEDPDFRRGTSAYDQANGDPDHRPNPCLGPLDTPPFFAVELLPGSVSTKGGLLCDADARVLDVADHPIPGLYACGSAMASSVGIGYPGAGGMLGPGMTFGFIAGDRVASDA
jgi:succinate dehydrogenase/fumarate reductase flavoprotein subunit